MLRIRDAFTALPRLLPAVPSWADRVLGRSSRQSGGLKMVGDLT